MPERARIGLVARKNLRLVVVSAPSAEPITVSGIKEHARITTNSDDDYISGLIPITREYAEDFQNRALIKQTLKMTLDDFPPGGGSIVVPRPPLLSVLSITYLDQNGASLVLTASVYRVDTAAQPGEISLEFAQEWPSTRGVLAAVTLTFNAGYGTSAANVPPKTRHAMKMLANAMYDHRDAYSDQSRGNIRALSPPASVDRLLTFDRVILV